MIRSPLRSGCIAVLVSAGAVARAASPFDPSDPDYGGRRGTTLYVSALGDGSDGTSWERAFRTIQAALLAVPDGRGGHRVIIRPGTYVEANLYPAYPGAEGAYNLLVGDVDGSFGSGAKGWDSASWELSPRNPVLGAGPGEGVNNSDVDLFEYEGATYLFYATGDQATWGAVRMAMFPGSMKDFFESLFPGGVPTVQATARRRP